MDYKIINKLNNVSETLFLPLYCRAIESNTKNPIIKDEKSTEIAKNLDKYFSENRSSFNEMLLKRKLPKLYVIGINLMTKKFDEYASNFLTKNPNGIIVNMGCGLDTRFFRIANEKVDFYDIDLPEVIELKKQFINEKDNYHFIGSSLLDYNWIKNISKKKNEHILFIAQGLFSYLKEDEVKSLIFELQKNFPGCEIVCDITNSYLIKNLTKDRIKKKYQTRFNVGKDITYYFGIKKADELMSWGKGIIFLDERSFFDEPHEKIKFYTIGRILEHIRKTSFIVHYKLN